MAMAWRRGLYQCNGSNVKTWRKRKHLMYRQLASCNVACMAYGNNHRRWQRHLICGAVANGGMAYNVINESVMSGHIVFLSQWQMITWQRY